MKKQVFEVTPHGSDRKSVVNYTDLQEIGDLRFIMGSYPKS